MHRFMVSAEKSKIEALKPLLGRDGMSVSSFFRKCVDDYLEAQVLQNEVISLNLDMLEGRR